MQATIYLHSNKENNLRKGQELGLNEKALNMFMYACYEVLVVLDVNEETGETTIIGINGKKL